MADLDKIIAEREQESARKHRELEIYDAETRGMILGRDLAPKPPASPGTLTTNEIKPKRGGRQPGAISQEWRNILGHLMINFPNGFSEGDVSAAALAVAAITIKPKDVRDRMEKYKEHGFISFHKGLYFVTAAAAEKFNFETFTDLTGIEWDVPVEDGDEPLPF